MRKSLDFLHHQLFHGSQMLPIGRRRDLQGLRIRIMLQGNSRENRLKGVE
jgi:hypothetical protein